MPSTTANKKSATGRRQSAPLGNCGNSSVDRSQETAVTRKQQRQKHRENLRHQAEVAPFLGLSDSEDDKADEKKAAKEETSESKESESKIVFLSFPLEFRLLDWIYEYPCTTAPNVFDCYVSLRTFFLMLVYLSQLGDFALRDRVYVGVGLYVIYYITVESAE